MSSPHTWPRLHTPAPLAAGTPLKLAEEQAHYLCHVLRLQPGESLRLFNAEHGEWRGEMGTVKKRSVEIHLHEQLRAPQSDHPLTLCCAPIKRAHFDFMVMKATELGVTRIQPVLTARTQIREVNLDRCNAIATEAAEQSERLSVPEIMLPVTLDKLVGAWPKDIIPLVCAEFGAARPIHDALLNFAKGSIAVITGPEGGFTTEEMERLHSLPGALAVRLGPRILRADTAALAALSCWQALCGDWR